MNKKRLIIVSTISIILVSLLFIGTTYSIFTSNDIDPNANVYTTGNLDITYTLSSDNVKLTDATPMSENNVKIIQPYRITVNNIGNVDYKFNIILTDTTATASINYDYIMAQVGKLEPISLSSTTSNIIKSDIIVKAGTSVPIDIRVYISSDIPNTEIGKNFSAKLSIDGIAVSYDKGKVDNSDLVANYFLLSEVEPGSYVAYTGNNGCSGASCSGQNANYVSDTNMGYCSNSSYKFTVNGWRVGYISDGTAYLVSAGAPTCLCTDSSGTVDTSGSECSSYDETEGTPLHIENLDNEALKYCNSNYAYGGVCNISSAWSIQNDDYNQITGNTLSTCHLNSSTDCGLDNTLIDNGGFYWYATPSGPRASFVFAWAPPDRSADVFYSYYSYGVRPILRLQPSVRVTGGSGTYEDPYQISKTAVDTVKKLYNDGSTINTVNIAGNSSKPQVKLNATQGIMLDNNGDYRYYGANPNNYVTFNGETWRIIGAFNNVDDGTGKKETRLKIIRNDSIGNYSYDSSASTVNSGNGVNDWSKADLNTELNTLYYNRTSGTCYNGSKNASTTCNFSSTGLGSTAKNMIGDAVFHLGGSSSYDGLYADDYYTFERGTTVYSCSTDDGACPRATTWTGKVGLMYPSDYAYATDLSLCTKDAYNYHTDTNCTSKDWLFNSATQWTIAPISSSSFYVVRVTSPGYVYGYDAYRTLVVRPAVYLKSNVAIVSGEGTSSNPYQLELT